VIQGFATGGPIMGLISGAMSIISNSISSIVKARIYNEQFTQSVTDYTNAIKNLKLQLNEGDYDTIFGVNSFRKVNDAIQKAKDSLDAYNSELNKKVSEPKWVNPDDKAFGKYLSELDAYKRGLTEIEAIQIKTRERSGFAEFWGFRDEYKSLKDFVPDLWGEDGVFNIANTEKFLEASGDTLNESQRKIIQNAIDLYKTYEDNMEVINEHLSDIFSDTASTIAERMMDSFAQTGDAATELGDLVSGVAKQMAKDLIQSLLVDQYLTPAMDRIKSLYNPQDKAYEEDATLRTQKAIVAMQEAISAAGQAVPEVNRLLEAIQAMGIDLSADSENASQVLSGLTEDQQNLLVSYINAIRADVSMNKGMLTSIVNSVGTINNNIATAIVIWTQIEANTHRSADGVDRIIGFFESVMGPYDGGAGQAFQVNIA
jgi:type II secretory pathway pseudopilin PulG